MIENWHYVRMKFADAGLNLHTATPREMADRVLVIYAEGGREAAEVLQQTLTAVSPSDSYQDPRFLAALAEAEQTGSSAMPEGMNLREQSAGVIPPP